MCKRANSPTSDETTMTLSNKQELICRTAPLNIAQLLGTGITDPASATTVELTSGSELYGLVAGAIAKEQTARSFTFDVGGGCCDSDEDECQHDSRGVECHLGLGVFSFKFGSEPLFAVHQTMGEVVGTNCGATLLRTLVLVAPGPGKKIDVIKAYCDKLLADADKTSDKKFTVYRFHPQYHYWRRGETVAARSIDSVVLPSALKKRVMEDCEEFLAKGTKQWYADHGIPYKHSLLLYGAPGAGKTSLIQAMAGHFKRNVCYLSPSHPEMTDDALKSAVQRVPNRSIIVLEDVDALFSHGRVKSAGDKSALTFSGVLNALDGVGGATGQIFVLTTNHRERLDPALIRNGRVDLHVEFTDACEEQMRGMMKAFYREATDEQAAEFARRLLELLGERKVSMAALQAYFIAMRKKTAGEAIEGVAKIIEEAEAHGGMKSQEEKEAAEKKKEKEGDSKEKKEGEEEDDEEEEEGEGGGKGKGKKPTKKAGKAAEKENAKDVHVHVHMHG